MPPISDVGARPTRRLFLLTSFKGQIMARVKVQSVPRTEIAKAAKKCHGCFFGSAFNGQLQFGFAVVKQAQVFARQCETKYHVTAVVFSS